MVSQKELISEVEAKSGHIFIGNCHASGTEIINELGKEHLDTGGIDSLYIW